MKIEFEPVEMSLRGAAQDGASIFCHTGVFDGCPLTVTYSVNLHEHKVRLRDGVGAVSQERILAALLSLSPTSLTPVPERFAWDLATGTTDNLAVIVEDPEGGMWGQRKLGVAVDVIGIEARANDWRKGSALAHRWVGYAARTVRLVRPIREDQTLLLTEAAHFGLGVVDGSRATKLLDPGPYEPRRWTPARWRFAELIYGQFRGSGAAPS